MLVLGTLLVQRRPHDGAQWRLGVQLLASRGWFLTRMEDGRLVRTSYGPHDLVTPYGGPPDDGPGGDLGGVREPRRPPPSTGSSSIALPPP